MRKIFIGADSAGFELKEEIRAYLTGKGYDVTDCGTDSTASCHYPVYASAVCEQVQKAPADTFGMSMCANKYNGVRAACCSDTYSSKMTRVHNDANVLCMGARVIGPCLAMDILDAFLDAEYEGGRHAIRVGMMDEIEAAQKKL